MPRGDIPPVLETTRLVLRPPRIEDAADITALWADGLVVRYKWRTAHRRGVLVAVVAAYRALAGAGLRLLDIEAKVDGRFIGEGGVASIIGAR